MVAASCREAGYFPERRMHMKRIGIYSLAIIEGLRGVALNKRLAVLGSLALSAGLLAGCKGATSKNINPETVAVPQFSAKNGLLLPETTRRSIGLKMGEVTEQKLTSVSKFELQVYEANGNSGRASGSVPLQEGKLLKVGQPVEVHLGSGKTMPAKVIRIDDRLGKVTDSMEVLVEIEGVSEEVTVGAFVQVVATGVVGENVASIPRSALLSCSEGYFVYTVSGEHLVRTAVKVGGGNDAFVEITDGLYSGDEVVLQPVMSLWMTELAAVKGGQACCAEPPKGK
jgi:hypothetical protein